MPALGVFPLGEGSPRCRGTLMVVEGWWCRTQSHQAARFRFVLGTSADGLSESPSIKWEPSEAWGIKPPW